MDGGSDVALSPTTALPAVAGDALQSYLNAIAAIPVLAPEEERDLARRWRAGHDLAAAQKLVMSNLRFVVHVARSYGGYGLALGDLIQEGNIGLMKAARRFDPDKGVRLITFAVHWIRSEIHEFIIRNWRIVKVATTKAQRKLFFRLRALKPHLAWLSQEETNAIARDLQVSPGDVRTMEARLGHHDATFHGASEDDTKAPEHYLAVADTTAEQLELEQEERAREQKMHDALQCLDDRSRDIVTRRCLQERRTGLRQLADEYGVSAERIRQIQNRAIATMRSQVGTAGGAAA